MDDEVLIVKCKVILHPRDTHRIREAIIDQMKEGVVVLPDYMEAIVVPKDVEVRVEQEDSNG